MSPTCVTVDGANATGNALLAMASPAGRQPSGQSAGQAWGSLASSNEPRHHLDMNESIAALVRRHDPDRFLTALFAPPEKRDALLTLYALNHELARAREVASEPPLALIRLQWWREVVEGEPRRHEVATPLSEAITAGTLDPDLLLPGAGGLAVAAAAALGAAEPEVVRPFGAAYGVAGLLRASGVLAAQHRCLLPSELLARHALSPEGFIHDPAAAPARAVLNEVAREGRALLAQPRANALPRSAVVAALPAVLARRDLRQWPAVATPRRFGDRMAVTVAGLTGRV